MAESVTNQPDQSSASQSDTSQPNQDPEIVREISLEEYQPKGTLAITLLYALIISLMWLFMYFVEFAGKGPSIID